MGHPLGCAIEDICRKALAQKPEARYQTVAELAEDLRHALRNEPLRDEANKILRRLVRWAHRQKLLAGLLVSAACLLAALPFMLDLVLVEDVTENEAQVSRRWHDARERRTTELVRLEGEETFAGLQRFLATVHHLTSERRMSRFVYLGRKPDE